MRPSLPWLPDLGDNVKNFSISGRDYTLGIKTIEEANKVLPLLLEEHNKKFAVKAQEADVYVPLMSEMDIASFPVL